MAEHIVSSNFNEKLPEIGKKLKDAVFVSMDCEFSGLDPYQSLIPSLFDDGTARYDILRQNLSQVIALQLGLSIFSYNESENKYSAHLYSFYVRPESYGAIDPPIIWQASTISFLRQQNFDFNKMMYEGVSYLNRSQEAALEMELTNDSAELPNIKEKELSKILQEVEQWKAQASKEDKLDVPCKTLFPILIHRAIRLKHPDLFTSTETDVVRVTKSQRDVPSNTELEAELKLSMLGLTRLFRLMEKHKCPIVGHNFLLDLIVMYNQFYEPIPSCYIKFKKKIIQAFPEIYDTKTLSYLLKRTCQKDMWEYSCLENIFEYCSAKRTDVMSKFAPNVGLAETQRADGLEVFHDAGWDAYCTGFCFIQLAFMFASHQHVVSELKKPRILTFKEILSAVRPVKNMVNLVRARIPHITLDGPDPASDRPKLLHVRTRQGKAFDIAHLEESLSKYGSVDIKMYSPKRALLATSTYGCAEDILADFHEHPDYLISPYSVVHHSLAVRSFLWSSAVVLGGLGIWLLWNGRRASFSSA